MEKASSVEDIDLEEVIVVQQVNTNENDVLSEVVVEGVNVKNIWLLT